MSHSPECSIKYATEIINCWKLRGKDMGKETRVNRQVFASTPDCIFQPMYESLVLYNIGFYITYLHTYFLYFFQRSSMPPNAPLSKELFPTPPDFL